MASKQAINRNVAAANTASLAAETAAKENMDATRTDTEGASAIKAAKEKYATAQAAGDKEGMKAAHDEAQSVRNKYGYTANSDGSEFTALGDVNKTTTATNKAVGDYTIGSAKGVGMYGALKNGESVTATDGWTWTKSADGVGTASRNGQTANIVVRPADSGTKLTGNIYQTTANGTPSGYGVGDLVVTNGGTYVIDSVGEDGKYSSSLWDKGTTLKNYKGSYTDGSNNNANNPTVTVTSANYIFNIGSDGSVTSATDKNGNAIDFSTIKPGIIGTGSGHQYIKTAEGKVKKVSSTGPEAKVKNPDTNAWENLTGEVGELFFGDDNITYLADGTTLKDWVNAKGYNADNYAVKLSDGNYYNLAGTPLTKAQLGMNALETAEKTFDGTNETLIDSLFSGIINTPSWDDGNILTYEQALARSKERLTPEYDAEMEDTLADMDRAAVSTGFYGQLPTEALKQQTAASIELEKASAIQDLANDLITQSVDTEEKRYNANYQTSQSRLSNIYQIYNQLWTQKEQQIENEQKDRELKLSEEELALEKDNARQEVILDAINLYSSAVGDGHGSDVLGYLQKNGFLS